MKANTAKTLIIAGIIGISIGIFLGRNTGFTISDYQETEASLIQKKEEFRRVRSTSNKSQKKRKKHYFFSYIYEAEPAGPDYTAGTIISEQRGYEVRKVFTPPASIQFFKNQKPPNDIVLRHFQETVSKSVFESQAEGDDLLVYYRTSKPSFATVNASKTVFRTRAFLLGGVIFSILGFVFLKKQKPKKEAVAMELI